LDNILYKITFQKDSPSDFWKKGHMKVGKQHASTTPPDMKTTTKDEVFDIILYNLTFQKDSPSDFLKKGDMKVDEQHASTIPTVM
jgi:hypothetical protein